MGSGVEIFEAGLDTALTGLDTALTGELSKSRSCDDLFIAR
jgi:hypothetical protein